MLYYCENCHALCEQNYCMFCGKKDLRNPNKCDYCFLTEVDSMFGKMFTGILEGESIPYSAMPSGNGVRSYFALNLENLKIFVVYEFFYRAKELLGEIFADFEEEERKNLVENIDKLFVPHRSEKKIKKMLKMAENESISAYCADKIISADRIINKGQISGCTKGGHYLFIYKDGELITVNSATYEILSVKTTRS